MPSLSSVRQALSDWAWWWRFLPRSYGKEIWKWLKTVPPGRCWSAFCSWALPGFRFIKPPPGFSQRYLRAFFVAAGLVFALTSFVGDSKHLSAIELQKQGLFARGLILHIEAESIFPLRSRHRDARVMSMSLLPIHPDIVAETVDKALAHDPYSPSLLRYCTEQHLRRGNFDNSLECLLELERVIPEADHTKQARALYDNQLEKRDKQ